MAAAFSRGHQRFEHLRGVLAQNGCNLLTRGYLLTVEKVALVRQFFRVQKTHYICLFLFFHTSIIAAEEGKIKPSLQNFYGVLTAA